MAHDSRNCYDCGVDPKILDSNCYLNINPRALVQYKLSEQELSDLYDNVLCLKSRG